MEDTVFTWPHLLVRHVVVALGVAATVLALGVAFAAPLRGLANPNQTPEPAKAPWYFAGLQELLSHFDPLVAGILVPMGAVLMTEAIARSLTGILVRSKTLGNAGRARATRNDGSIQHLLR